MLLPLRLGLAGASPAGSELRNDRRDVVTLFLATEALDSIHNYGDIANLAL